MIQVYTSFFKMTRDLLTPTGYSSVADRPAPAATALVEPSSQIDYDLVIVGGGLVGLTFACALRQSGLQVALLEARPESAAVERGQAYHVNLQSSRIFRGIGAWQSMQAEVNPIAQIRLSDADYPKVVQFLPADLGTPVLGYVAEHRVLLQGLQHLVSQSQNVTCFCPAELLQADYQPDQVILQVNVAGQKQTLRTRLLVAADGARSPIRQRANISTYGWQYRQACVVAFIQPEKPHQNIAYERFWSSGPFAILPLPNNLCRIVWTAPKAEAEAILALDEAEFLARLQQRFGDQMGRLSLVGSRYLFPVQLMHSRRYVHPRLALIGDAAHCCHPVGGQGVNLGIRDAAALAEILSTAHRQGQDIGAWSILRRFEQWRQPENWIILGFTDSLVRVFSNNWLPLVSLRRLGLWGLRRISPVRQLALQLMTGLSGRQPIVATAEPLDPSCG